MSKKPDELQAGALNAWTPLQQAALYQNYLSKVKENEEGEKLKAYETAEAEKKKGPKVKPEAVKAGKVIDDLVKDWCPPLFAFLDVFGPPHLAIIGYLGAHAAFWSVSPWYLHHLLVYPTLYLIPLFNAYVSISSRKDRMIWQVWLVELCLVEYLELLFFRDSASSLLWWPKMKALIFVLLYCRIGSEEGKTDPRTRVKEKVKVYGCMLVIKPWLDSIENEHKQKEKAEKEKKEKEKEKEKEKDGKEEDKGKSSKDGDKDKEKARAKAKAAAKAKASGK